MWKVGLIKHDVVDRSNCYNTYFHWLAKIIIYGL